MILKRIEKPQFNPDEIYQKLRTNIEFAPVQSKLQVLCVTSSCKGDGNTTIASHLAEAFAKKYENVLLIDCNMRKPAVHEHFKMPHQIGLSDVLLNNDTFTEVLCDQYIQEYKNKEGVLHILSAGSDVSNPLELLSSERFSKLIECLREHYECIILDCPPVLYVSDAIPVSNLADGTIYVVSAEDTSKKDAKAGLKLLERNGAKVIGSVLNKVDMRLTDNEYCGYY